MGTVLAAVVLLMLIAWPLALWLGYRTIKRKVRETRGYFATLFRKKGK